MKLRKYLAFVALLPLINIGCAGGGGDEPGTPNTGAVNAADDFNTFLAATPADLPTCDDSREGQLFYVQSTNDFRACTSGNYSVINIQGQDGNDGENGLAANKSTVCSKIVTVGTTSLLLFYQFVEYNNGDVLVNCRASGLESDFASNFFFSGQTGATTKGCSVISDVETDTGDGFWSFLDDGTDLGAIYNDSGSTFNNQAAIFDQDTECTVIER